MEKYVDVKIVKAEPMYRRQAYDKGYHRVAADESILDQPNDYGYHIQYDNGYNSWCPEKEFRHRNKPANALRETALLMNSDDPKELFIAEYIQLCLRYNDLNKKLVDWDNIEIDVRVPREVYDDQLWSMLQYIKALEKRAKISKIHLPNIKIN